MGQTFERIQQIQQQLCKGLIAREIPMKLLLLGALSGEHVLLIGPPGTAKSLLARRLYQAFKACSYFECLATKFTMPEELFGPFSLPELEHEKFRRLTTGYLPEANIAFLDEIFKSHESILNTLLTILNERVFNNASSDPNVKGPQQHPVHLISLVGASNELPTPGTLDALYDRFLIRVEVNRVSTNDFARLLTEANDEQVALEESLRFSYEEQCVIETAAKSKTEIEIPQSILKLLTELRSYLDSQSIFVSDRRWLKIVKLLKVSALTHDRQQVEPLDCLLIPYCVWTDHQDAEGNDQLQKLSDWITDHIWQGPPDMERQIIVYEKELQRKLVEAQQPELFEPTLVVGLLIPLREALQTLQSQYKHLKTHEHRLSEHLWLGADVIQPSKSKLSESLKTTSDLVDRLQKVIEGFEYLSNPQKTESFEYQPPQAALNGKQTKTFKTKTVDKSGQVIKETEHQAQYFVETFDV